MTTTCPACTRLPSFLKCNAHRTEAMSTTMVRKAQAKGYKGTDPLAAEKFVGARGVVIN